MAETTNAVEKREDKVMEFVPFGGKENIKLSVAIVKSLIAVPTKSGKLPSDRDCMKFLMMCKARLLNPFESDAFLIGYDGNAGPTFSLITAHQAFLKRAELNPEYDGMKSGVIVEENGELKDLEGDFFTAPSQKVVGGWATVFFRNRKYPMHKRIRLARFKKQFGIWTEDEAGMICKCAEADALRSSFPTMLGGLYLEQELQREEKTGVPIFKEQAQPEPVIDVSPPAEVKVAPVPQEAPKAAEAVVSRAKAKPQAPKPVQTPPEPPNEPLAQLEARIDASGVTQSEVLSSLNDILGENHASLADMAKNAPESFAILESQLEDIIERIKTA